MYRLKITYKDTTDTKDIDVGTIKELRRLIDTGQSLNKYHDYLGLEAFKLTLKPISIESIMGDQK